MDESNVWTWFLLESQKNGYDIVHSVELFFWREMICACVKKPALELLLNTKLSIDLLTAPIVSVDCRKMQVMTWKLLARTVLPSGYEKFQPHDTCAKKKSSMKGC